MEKIFYPESILIIGLSSRPNNIPRMILENLLRWGFNGRIFGLNPKTDDPQVDGIKMYKSLEDLPEVPDLAVCLIPAKFVPETVEACGKLGIRRMAIPSGGFSEYSEEGQKLADMTLAAARKYNIRFVGPNGVTVANTENGLCLPFVPLYRPPSGSLSIISQSGGVGLIMWNLLQDENIGMAKFASIGNKLDLDEVDFLKYFGEDPETKIICMYLESIAKGKELIRTAMDIDKPIIVFKSNTTNAGKSAAMSHTAAISNDEDIIDSAFKKAGIIRIHNYRDFVATTKMFKMPPMKGKRIMVMSPAGGFSVITADLCENAGFEFADPGEEFYKSLQNFSNAGVINFSNPLDMGDIYDPKLSSHIFYSVVHNKNVDGAIYVSQWPHMPSGNDVFTKMFRTDLSKETWGAILSSGKPVGVCLFGLSSTIAQIKKNTNFPIFDSPEEAVRAMKMQMEYYTGKQRIKNRKIILPDNIATGEAKSWIKNNRGFIGEEIFELLSHYGINVPSSQIASSEQEAIQKADKIGYPVVMKVVSPDALHKSDVGGVVVGIKSKEEAGQAFNQIKQNLSNYKKDAAFAGVRVQQMAGEGFDMFIGGKYDQAFGPVVMFGFGGIYIEVFADICTCICPCTKDEVLEKLTELKSYKMLTGIRGGKPADIDALVDMIVRISILMKDFPEIKELDLNPIRIFEKGKGSMALDARASIVH